MNIFKELADNYGIHTVTKLKDVTSSNACYLVISNENKYIFKKVPRIDFIQTYNKVEKTLNKLGLRQSSIIPTKDKSLITQRGYCLFEYIEGESKAKFARNQFAAVIKTHRS